MKKNQTIRLVAVFLVLLPVTFTACVKDKCTKTNTYSWFTPIYKTKDEVRANIKSNAPRDLVNTGKIYIFGNYIFLNEIDKGIHVINNANPSSPQRIAFIDIPGNLDIAVKGNTLYADLYTDLIAIDISNPTQVTLKKIIENQFPYRYWGMGFVPDNSKIIVDWVRHDTTVTESCDRDYYAIMEDNMGGGVFLGNAQSFSAASSTSSPAGIGGSMARFTLMNDRLYTVSNSDLDVFNITNTEDPYHVNKVSVGWNIETVYPFKDRLFIGSQTGMYIYNVSNPDAPAALGQFQHMRSCDPVIADDTYAYVTLSGGTPCGGDRNELDILNITNLNSPQLLKVYQLNSPKGLSKTGNHLFICDGDEGLKIFNASNVTNLQLVKTISGIDAYDVITYNNVALVVAKDGLYQYNYSDISNIRLLSKIRIAR